MTTEFKWAEAWAERLSMSSHRAKLRKNRMSSEDYWDKFSPWKNYHTYNKYPGRALERILEQIDSQSTVLDVGAGSGALTIPVAGVAKHVTAIEPSQGQIDRLREEAGSTGMENIRIISKRWEDISPAEIDSYDVVTAGYCFQMEDISEALEKMYRVARKHVYLLHFVDHDLLDTLRDILDELDSGPDYIYLYNVLYEMGHRASLEVIRREYEMPLDLQLDMFGYSYDLSPQHKELLREHLVSSGKIRSRDGLLWVKRVYRDALIHLDKNRNNGKGVDCYEKQLPGTCTQAGAGDTGAVAACIAD